MRPWDVDRVKREKADIPPIGELKKEAEDTIAQGKRGEDS